MFQTHDVAVASIFRVRFEFTEVTWNVQQLDCKFNDSCLYFNLQIVLKSPTLCLYMEIYQVFSKYTPYRHDRDLVLNYGYLAIILNVTMNFKCWIQLRQLLEIWPICFVEITRMHQRIKGRAKHVDSSIRDVSETNTQKNYD